MSEEAPGSPSEGGTPAVERGGLLAIGLAVVAVLGPVLLHPGTRVVGSPSVDGFGTQWFFWFASEVLSGRQPAGVTDLLFHPWGKDLYAHTGGNLVDAWLAAPLRAVLGPVAGFDAWVVVVLLTNAWAGLRLAAAFGAPRRWRWAAGLALVLNPYVLAEIDLGRVTQAWLAPAGLALAGLVAMRSVRGAALAGLALGLSGLAYWYYGLLLGAIAVLQGVWALVAGPERTRAFGLFAVAAAVALLVTLPFAAPMVRALGGGEVPGLLALDGTGPLAPLALRTVEGDEQGLYVIAPLLGAAGSLLEDGGLRFSRGLPAYFWVHLLAGLLGLGVLLARGGVRRWGWVVGAWIVAVLVASGPAIVLGDHLVPNRPWIALVTAVDVLRRWWWPGRAVFLLHLLVAGLLPVLLSALPRVLRIPTGAGILLVALALLRRDALAPVASWDATVPPALRCLAAAPPGAVIDLPLLVDQKNLWFQTVHHKPLLGGMLLKKTAFAPAEFTRLRAEDPLLQALEAIGDRHYTRDMEPATPEVRAALASHGYRYVVARIDAFRRPRTAADGEVVWVSEWSRPRRQLLALLGAPAAEDDTLGIWMLDGGALPCGPDGGRTDGAHDGEGGDGR
ncbi:MAG: hypothetical protein Q8P18_12450 [Pseudomonadota bacterium]|nr:hypothetical protein [Pseudomonadota bacterium]